MNFRSLRNMNLSTKILVSFGLLLVLPVSIVTIVSFQQLSLIQDLSRQGTNKILIDTQLKHIEDLLSQEAKRLSLIFFRVQDETHSIGNFAEHVLAAPERFQYRNGSKYALKASRPYIMPAPDGNSALYIYKAYRPAMLPAIEATEAMDLLWKPLASREPMLDVAWLIDADGFSRTFPWQNFHQLQLPTGLTDYEMPFFYLAGPKKNPSGAEVFTPVYQDPLIHKWLISCLAPVMVKGQHKATVGIDITLPRLLKALSEIRITQGSSSILFSGTEIVAASDNLPLKTLGLNPDLPSFGQDLFSSTSPKVRELVTEMWQKEALIKRVDLPGMSAYVGSAVIEPLRWRVILIVPENDVLSPARESSQQVVAKSDIVKHNFIALILAVAFAAGCIVFLALMHQSNGLRTLFFGIREFGAGRLNHRIPEDGSEFGQLGQALNTMAASLIEKHRELQRINAEVEQERKLSAVGRLAAGVAHEVNNPLATIATHAQMLMRREDIPADAQENLRKVMGEIKRIQGNMRNLLDLSRLQSPVKSAVDPNHLIREVIDLARHEAQTRGVEIVLDLTEENRKIEVDCSGLKQILWNLLGNAIQVQAKGGTVTVRTRYPADRHGLVLDVEDAGPGISEEILPKIFEPFFTTKEFGQGTGLGLATVFGIVQAHGGKIEVENLQPTGCRFRIFLPEEP